MTPEELPSFSSAAQSLIPGSIYEHYKGLCYKILGIAHHSETLSIKLGLSGAKALGIEPLEKGLFSRYYPPSPTAQSQFLMLTEH